jgi:hypothetical protein
LILSSIKRNKPPQPQITYTPDDGNVSITYPPDMFDSNAAKQYIYTGGLQTYSGPFTVTERGFVTAIHEDIAGNRSTAMLQVSPVRPPATPPPGVPPVTGTGEGNGTGGGIIIEETRNAYVYFINFRGSPSDPGLVETVLGMLE